MEMSVPTSIWLKLSNQLLLAIFTAGTIKQTGLALIGTTFTTMLIETQPSPPATGILLLPKPRPFRGLLTVVFLRFSPLTGLSSAPAQKTGQTAYA